VMRLRTCVAGHFYTGKRCPRCPPSSSPRRERPSAARRGYTKRWQHLVRLAIHNQPYCSNCGSATDLTGDHITPLSAGGQTTLANIQVLCRSCNSAKGGERKMHALPSSRSGPRGPTPPTRGLL
jgi:5-methylcytosine-specific restriction protein A